MQRHRALGIALLLATLVACSGPTSEPTGTTIPPPTTAAASTTTLPEPTTTGDATTTSVAAVLPAPGELPLAPTPAQQEGPYYPVDRLADQDDDLTVVEGLDGVATGEVLVLSGTLLTTEGEPVAGAVIEIWQTDANGIYLHPADPGLADRDPYFQGSGTASVADDGTWEFRTLNPGYYESRPRHIHVKVHVDGVPVLTTQIYFDDDAKAAGIDELLVAHVTNAGSGQPAAIATHRLVLGG